ncbi:Aspartokinase [Phlyctochytrium planicorne]|nr:Aspartokinase [Phlyctochytrium planicorne]
MIIQKYGGTSVGTAERMKHVASIVKLLEAAEDILLPNSTLYLDIVSTIEKNHLNAVREAISDEEIRKETEANVRSDCEKLKSFMSAAEIIDEISPRSRDVIVSTGEKLSARIFTSVLRDQGIKASFVNLDKLITQQFEQKSLDQTFYDYLTRRLKEVVDAQDPSHVLVVTGFLGPVPGSILASIGRGYTDLTAALIAVATSSQELQIWKEVDGIFTADPRKAPNARLLSSISPEEAAELTYYGSEVIHPFTMEQVIRASIPIRIKNTFKPDGAGTLILPNSIVENGIRSKRKDSFSGGHATAVTIKDNVVVLNVHSNRKSVSHGFFAQIFSTLDKFGIVIDLISTSEVHISMALNPNIVEKKLEAAIVELRKYGTVDTIPDMAILSLVGREMRNSVGIASLMFSTLAKHKVNIEMISQGASEINISCVISEKMAQEALRAMFVRRVLTACSRHAAIGTRALQPVGRMATQQLRFNSSNEESPSPGIFNAPLGALPKRPDDIAYFTGNPKYFRFLTQLNEMIRRHQLPFQDPSVYQSIKSLPKWMSADELRDVKQFKITERMYLDFIHKLNVLFTVQANDPAVSALLSDFVKPGETLTGKKQTAAELDEFGRSYTRGSRKTAVAQCWMVEGDGQVYVNGVKMAEYFPQISDCQKILLPFEATESFGKYNVWAIASGGGISGQAQAVAVAVARGLVVHDPVLEDKLSTLGLTKIDRRQVERKKTGQPKARKKNTCMSIECSLNGVVSDNNLSKLLERMVGLCGFLEFDGKVNLFEHEIVFSPEVKASYGQSDVFLRLRAAVYHKAKFLKLYDRVWRMVFTGPYDPPKPNSRVMTRVVNESVLKGDVFQYMKMLGYM